ncbi:MAG: transporter associated domain-containing protein, partial [Bacilli bacterium]
IDNVIGVLNTRDLLNELIQKEDFNIKKLLRPAIFVSEVMTIDSVLKQMKINKSHLVIVVDEYGSFTGIMTMEDILEELVGEIYDEYDDEEDPDYIKIDDTHFRVSGEMDLEDLFIDYLHDKDLPKISYSTVGGFVYHQLGSIPKLNDSFIYRNYEFIVTKIELRRVKYIDVIILNDDLENSED